MANEEILLWKRQDVGLKISGKARKHTLRWKLMDLRVDVYELTKNGSNQPPPSTVSISAPSF